MRIRHAQNRREFETIIDELITQGYKVVQQGEGNAQLKKTDYGSVVVHVLLLVFIITAVWGNLVYALLRNSRHGDAVLVKTEAPQQGAPSGAQFQAV